MEDAPLTPPAWLEQAVSFATPPLARETVLGDLCETYVSPRVYAVQALAVLPFVIASQMRRHLNWPLLLLQVALLDVCFGASVAAIATPLLMLRDAWQPLARPTPRWALRQAVLAAFIGVTALQIMSNAAHQDWSSESGNVLIWLELFFIGPVLLPLLGLLRTGLIVDSDRRPLPQVGDLAITAQQFARTQRWKHMLEAAALMLAAILVARSHAPLAICFAVAALWLVLEAFARVDASGDALTLRTGFARTLARQQQARRFLCWLWFSPLLMWLHGHYLQSANPMAMILGVSGITLLCFTATALTHEHGGRVREQIGVLERQA